MPIDPTKTIDRMKYIEGAMYRGKQALKFLRPHFQDKIKKNNYYGVLDVASGTGSFLTGFMRPFIEDINGKIGPGKMMHVIRADVKGETLFADEFKKANSDKSFISSQNILCLADKITLSNGSIDLMLFCNALEHFDENLQRRALKDAHRLLDNEGRLIVVGPVSSPLERGEYFRLKRSGLLARGPINDVDSVKGIIERADEEVEKYVGLEPSSGKSYFLDGAWPLITGHHNPGISRDLRRIFKGTKELVDLHHDPDHKIWFSPTSLKRLLHYAGFALCAGGEIYFTSGATRGADKAKEDEESKQSFKEKKHNAHAQMYICRKV